VLLREYKKIVSPVACVSDQQGQRGYHFITILQEMPTKYTNKTYLSIKEPTCFSALPSPRIYMTTYGEIFRP
jgi:hypothetical protein